jgi:P27 family predicted phage terminase small subunit
MKPGKKSSADLNVPPVSMTRPEPLAGLSEYECELWRQITISLPADWFRPSDLPLLASYCQAHAEHDQARAGIEKDGLIIKSSKGRDYKNPLISVRHQAALRMATLATKMRLCQSARYDKNKAASATAGDAYVTLRGWELWAM